MVNILPAKMKALLVIAAHLTGYPIPPGAPPVGIELTTAEMRVFADDDTTIGMTRDRVDVIFVDVEFAVASSKYPDLGGPDEDSILIHELTHWLQAHNGQAGYECPRILDREREAYAVQTRFAREYEHHPDADFRPPPELYAYCKEQQP